MPGHSAGVKSAKEKLRKRLIHTRTRLEEFFKDYDKLNRKKVSRAQTERVLDLVGAGLSAEETREVLDAWSNPDGMFRYLEFCDFMDKVFTRKGLETNPSAKLANPMAGKPLHEYGQKMDEEEKVAVADVLATCTDLVSSRGVIVKDFFHDFDRRNNGYVSESQFARELLHCFPSLPEAAIGLLVKKYSDGSDVNYRAFHVDVTPDAVAPGRVAGGYTAPAVMYNKKLGGATAGGAEAVEARLVRQVKANRVRVQEFFRDFDAMRTGYCSRAQFLRGLSNCKFQEVTDGDLNLLADKYNRPERGAIAYQEFCDEMGLAFTAPGLERAPTKSLDSSTRAMATGPRRPVPSMSAAEKRDLDSALDMIRTEIIKRRFEMKPFFKDFDRANEECVTKAQFMRVLKQINAMPAGAELAALLKRYPGPGVKSSTHVDWRTFLQDVEEPDLFTQDEMSAARARASMSSALTRVSESTDTTVLGVHVAGQPVDIEKALHRVKLAAKKNCARIEEFYRDFDKLRRGFITRHQFDTGLNNAQVRLHPEEVDALCDTYVDERARDPAGKPMVNWRRFCDDVDSVFTKKGLESKPGVDVEAETKEALYTTGSLSGGVGMGKGPAKGAVGPGGRLNAGETEALRDLLSTMASQVATKRLELPANFREFDRHNLGYLAKPNFNRALDRVGLALSGDELDLVKKAFRVPAPDREDINYRWFIRALEDVDGVLAHLPDADARPGVSTAVLEGKTKFVAGMPVRTVRASGGAGGARSAAELVDFIKEEALRRRLRLKEFMVDYDKLRTGRLTRPKFRSAIAAAGLRFEEGDLRTLEEAYKHDADHTCVNWRELAFQVDGGDEELERDPRKEIKRFVPSEFKEADTGVDGSQLDGILEHLRDHVSQRNVLMKPSFQSFDRLRRNYVTRAQFASVLATLRLPATVPEVRLLQDAFMVRGQKDLVNYHNFVRRLDAEEI